MRILHWYYDIMNLYGEYANIKILEKYLKKQFNEIIIDYKTVGENVNVQNYDYIYIGCGTERNQLIVLEDIRKYSIEIKKYIEDNKFILATGNAWEIFGNEFIFNDNSRIKGLQIFDYNIYIKEERMIKDIICTTELVSNNIIGSINKMSIIINNNHPLFNVEYSIGYNENNEGFKYNNFYGTHLLGPVLIKNPYFLEYIIKKICEIKYITYKNLDFNKYEIMVYKESIKELICMCKKYKINL